MKAVEFCYWLQGNFEVANVKSFDEAQTDQIRKHLALVFKHEIDPSYPAKQQEELNKIHSGNTPQGTGMQHGSGTTFRC